ncbi:MAG: 1-(5-phosphoribosyl)-5-[(5-phosphoribosylamino)methylideneamino]imidazole-4-carboxamide isomerase [Clostridia bacterium]|nr:1-(5-phosphoribosyl)-5-[(5-phosphoribosylamino)methylideneamino]imidazole-4-carboxamide isomerase [Clostridia bacterium]
MRIYPAIDLRQGRCVRLVQGNFDKQTVYSHHPEQIAAEWEQKGAKFIHVVDLDGAYKGLSQNFNAIKKILNSVNIPIQVGGGIRSIQDIDRYLDAGVNRVIMGTAAIKNPEILDQALNMYGEKVVVGIDAKNGFVATDAWTEVGDVSVYQLADKMYRKGVKNIIYTDISKDGTLTGPNIDTLKALVDKYDANIISSGGVASIEDVRRIKETGAAGVIVGKALYSGVLNLEELLKLEV